MSNKPKLVFSPERAKYWKGPKLSITRPIGMTNDGNQQQNYEIFELLGKRDCETVLVRDDKPGDEACPWHVQ